MFQNARDRYKTNLKDHRVNLREIWSGESTPIAKVLQTVILALPAFSFANFFMTGGQYEAGARRTRRMDFYILIFVVLLTLLWLLIGFGVQHRWLQIIAYVVAGFRVADSVTYRLYFIFIQSRKSPWDPITARRSLGIAFVNVYEIVVAYAIYYLLSGSVIAGEGQHVKYLSNPSTAFYYSFTTITIFNSEFSPTTGWTQLLVISELAVGFVFLVLIIPMITSIFADLASGRRLVVWSLIYSYGKPRSILTEAHGSGGVNDILAEGWCNKCAVQGLLIENHPECSTVPQDLKCAEKKGVVYRVEKGERWYVVLDREWQHLQIPEPEPEKLTLTVEQRKKAYKILMHLVPEDRIENVRVDIDKKTKGPILLVKLAGIPVQVWFLD